MNVRLRGYTFNEGELDVFIQQFLLDLVGVTTDQVYFDIGMSFPETGPSIQVICTGIAWYWLRCVKFRRTLFSCAAG